MLPELFMTSGAFYHDEHFSHKHSSASSHSAGRASGDYLGPQNSCLKDTPTIWISFATAATATTTSSTSTTTTATTTTAARGAFFCLNSFQWTSRVPATIWRPPSSQVFVKHMTLKKILKYGPEKKTFPGAKNFSRILSSKFGGHSGSTAAPVVARVI